MTAPLPLRFYNPVKELCSKVSLDYETVVGTGIKNKVIREAFLNSEVDKIPSEFKAEDRKSVKHKKDFFDKKYGGANSTTGASESEATDNGRSRYDAGLIVESVLPEPSKVDESEAVSGSVGDSQSTASEFGRERAKFRPREKWIPNRGVE